MKNLTIKISDIKRQNTTIVKLQKTLARYDLSKKDKVIFYIKDMYNPPTDKDKWKRILKLLQQLVFNATYYKDILFDDKSIMVNIPEVEIKFGKKLQGILYYI